jgi:hypothetical protein
MCQQRRGGSSPLIRTNKREKRNHLPTADSQLHHAVLRRLRSGPSPRARPLLLFPCFLLPVVGNSSFTGAEVQRPAVPRQKRAPVAAGVVPSSFSRPLSGVLPIIRVRESMPLRNQNSVPASVTAQLVLGSRIPGLDCALSAPLNTVLDDLSL